MPVISHVPLFDKRGRMPLPRRSATQLEREMLHTSRASLPIALCGLASGRRRRAQLPTRAFVGQDQVITLTMDGTGQAKFKTPRTLNNNKNVERRRRPTLRMVGVIVHGHVETYFIMHSKVPKVKSKGAAMPGTHIVGADNARESKNQFFSAYIAKLVALETFKATQVEFMRVGHTHDEQYQRFSSVATALSSARTEVNPSEFKSYMEQHVKPVKKGASSWSSSWGTRWTLRPGWQTSRSR